MRMMLKVHIPVESGNKGVFDGTMHRVLGQSLEHLKPEAAYFCADQGARTAYLVFDLKDVSDIPSIAEPFFNQLNAKVELKPVMNFDDLRTGLGKLRG
jgi:hypothetical protein